VAAQHTGAVERPAATLPAVAAIGAAAALGEARGYLLGERDVRERFLRWELHAPRSPSGDTTEARARW
jgi:hypothetical protein